MAYIFSNLVNFPDPAQERSREALERLLTAGESLLAQNRYEEAGIAEIARIAKSSVGTFYRLLSDKETLSLLLLQRFFNQLEDEITEITTAEQWQDKSINDFANQIVGMLVDLYQGRGGTLRAVILKASCDLEFRQLVHQYNDFISQRIALLLKQHKDEIHHPKPNECIQFVGHLMIGILNQFTVTGQLGGITHRNIKNELAYLLLSYLGVKTSS